jgi:mannose-6-phosphate isomerase-like protein (cupin superfamily)
LHIPPGVAHQVRNESAADVRFLVISAPRSHGDRELVPLDEEI